MDTVTNFSQLTNLAKDRECLIVHFINNHINNNNKNNDDENLGNLKIARFTTDIHLLCDFKMHTDWTFIDDVYYCNLAQNIKTDRTNPKIIGVNKTHDAGRNNVDVKGFRVHGKQLHYFPQGLTKFFKNLEFLIFSQSGLIEVTQKDLQPFVKLQYLGIMNCRIESIEKDLFKFNPNLKVISLSRNSILFIAPNVFSGLRQLKTLQLQANICINKSVNNNVAELKALMKFAGEKCNKK